MGDPRLDVEYPAYGEAMHGLLSIFPPEDVFSPAIKKEGVLPMRVNVIPPKHPGASEEHRVVPPLVGAAVALTDGGRLTAAPPLEI